MAAPSEHDKAFLQAMIDHNKASVKMAQDYLTKPSSQRLAVVSDLARSIIASDTAEVKTMMGMMGSAAPAGANAGVGKGSMG